MNDFGMLRSTKELADASIANCHVCKVTSAGSSERDPEATSALGPVPSKSSIKQTRPDRRLLAIRKTNSLMKIGFLFNYFPRQHAKQNAHAYVSLP